VSLIMAAFTYLVSWCITIFMVLPFQLTFKRTLLWNTVLATVVTLAIYLLIKSGLVPLRDVY